MFSPRHMMLLLPRIPLHTNSLPTMPTLEAEVAHIATSVSSPTGSQLAGRLVKVRITGCSGSDRSSGPVHRLSLRASDS